MDSFSDRRWHELKSPTQRAIYRENQRLQLQAELDFLRRENERLALLISARERAIIKLLSGDQTDITTTSNVRPQRLE